MTWRSFDESMPTPRALASSGEYAVKHNPAAYERLRRRGRTTHRRILHRQRPTDPSHRAQAEARPVSVRLRVNPIVCDGHGLCAELFPERITLDDWGFPIIDHTPVGSNEERHARRAVDACPTLALALIPAGAPRSSARMKGGE
jgi:ferredoxin